MVCGVFPWAKAHCEDESFAAFASGQRSSAPWNHFSDEFLVLLDNMLAIDPADRPSVSNLRAFINIPWWKGDEDTDLPCSKTSDFNNSGYEDNKDMLFRSQTYPPVRTI
eukprot:m.74633 g.74633  ORF g.74633 m.74633 type:complete len:109 (+) comp20443_c0_seq2:1-327(+)